MKKPEPKEPDEIDVKRIINLAKDMLQAYEQRGIDYSYNDTKYLEEEIMKEVFGPDVYKYINSL